MPSKKSLTAEQKRMMALENRVEELEEHINGLLNQSKTIKDLKYEAGDIIFVECEILDVDNMDKGGRPYQVRPLPVSFEDEVDYEPFWMSSDMVKVLHAEDQG